ncbi:MAG: hypothetical protein PHU25_13825 [Deltaproteobacteria bacterium]|nr:hypothetical protein [Deltaproteobacteria bacterium]
MRGRCRTACALVAVLFSGCAPSITNLERFLDSGELDKAVADVAGKPGMQAELAALLLERAARNGVDVEVSVRTLASGASPGRRALERLSERGTSEAARLAFVALHRTSAPDEDNLARYLADDSSIVRAAAAEAWADEVKVEALRAMAADPEPKVRVAAVRELARREEDESTLLRDVLRLDPDARVRSEAARSGPALGGEALAALKDALRDPVLGVRMAVARGLAALETPDATARLADLCASPLDEVGVSAAAELCRAKGKGCDRLVEALSAQSATLRQTALLHLDRARMEHRDSLVAKLLDDPDPGVAVQAASMLAGKEDHKGAAAKTLRRVAASAAPEARDALFLLATWGDPDAQKEVAIILKQGDEEEIVAALAGTTRSFALLGSFVPLLADGRERVRLAAARAVLTASTPS